MDDLYPGIEYIDTIQRYLYGKMNIEKFVDLVNFIDLKFADNACRR